MKLKIFIPTHRRVARQVTLTRMPEALQRQVTLVPSDEEDAEYLRSRYPAQVVVAKGTKSIGEKRDWILAYAKKKGYPRIVMLDDDLVLQKRREDLKITNLEGKEFIQAFEWMDKALQKYAHATFGMRFLAYDKVIDEEYGKRAVYVLGFDVKKFHAAKVGFTKDMPPMSVMEDFHATLQLLTAGHPNVLSHVWRVSPYASNKGGGCKDQRTPKHMEASAKRLVKLYPGLVKLREKKAWDGVGQATQTDVTVYWQKALKQGEQK